MSDALPVFASSGLQAQELGAHQVPLLQAFFDANPAYFQVVNGRPAEADEAQREFDEDPPAHLSWTRRWFMGLFDADGTLSGAAIVVSDLCAPGVWHLAFYVVATRLHGSGLAQETYDALERWVRDQGAVWMRLGVALSNGRARRFWQRQGFIDLRLRQGMDTGGRLNDVHICCKPLTGAPIEDYLRLVPRDAPGSTLP